MGLVLGCVQRLFDPAVNAAAVQVLGANGIEVVIPPGPGLLRRHDPPPGRRSADPQPRHGPDRQLRGGGGPGRPAGAEPLDAVLVAASGCGHTLKHYDALLASEPAWAARGSAFAAGVADLQEFLERVGLSEALPARPAAPGPCRRQPGQRRSPPATGLSRCLPHAPRPGHPGAAAGPAAAIPHVEIREAVEAGVCCGSAGIYNLVQPEEAAALGRIKADDLRGTGADLVVSANIGCSLQIRRHLDDTPVAAPLPVVHPVQLLERSFRATPA